MSEELWTCKKHCEGEWYVYKGEEIISSTDNEIDANSFCEEHNASIQRVLEKKEAVTRNTAVLQMALKWIPISCIGTAKKSARSCLKPDHKLP